jgi:hypothetical protein
MTFKELQSEKIKPQDKEVASFIDQLYTQTLSKYMKLHRDWYLNERFVRGDHWIVYNKTLNKIQTLPVSDGEIRRTINKIRTQLRGVKNFIKRNQPRWEAHPEDSSDESLKNAQKTNKILQYYYRILKIKSVLTDIIVSGLKYSVGFLEAAVVETGKETKIKLWHDDTFSILLDLDASHIQDCRYILKVMKKPVTQVQENKNYKIAGNIGSDSKENGGSTYKEMLEQEKYGTNINKGVKDLESTLVKELWIKWYDENGKSHVKIFTNVSDQLVRVQETKYRRYPFFSYNPEHEPGAIYSDAWIKDLIQINKSLDKSVSQIEGYIQRMLAGKFMIKQGVEVSSITDKGAEKIYYKGSVPPTQLELQPLPSTPFSYTNNLERWIEEGGGMREASLGRAPSGIQSGKGVEALQAADASTVAEPVENLETFLEEISEFILELLTDYQITSMEITEENESIKFIGGEISNEEVPDGVMKLKPLNVRVAIVPEIAYSEDAKFDRLMQLANAQMIDPQTILEKLSISNVSDIIERMNKAKEEGFKQEMMKQKESHRTSGNAPEDTADLADQENMQISAGQEVPMTPQAVWAPEHTELHLAFIQENQDAYTQYKNLFDAHIQNEEQYQAQQQK